MTERHRLLRRVPDVAERVEERPSAEAQEDDDEEGNDSLFDLEGHRCRLRLPHVRDRSAKSVDAKKLCEYCHQVAPASSGILAPGVGGRPIPSLAAAG